MSPSLAPMLAALQQPAAYPHPVDQIVHLETHISHVFLAGDYAYKLKKPVDFGFLDFTTAEKRRAACADEVRLNARLAPDFYLGVVPVCHSAAGYHVRPEDCAPDEAETEVLVQMRRFPQDGLLDHLAMAGRLTPAIMTDIAQQLAQFHATAARGPEIDQFGSVESIRAPVLQNFVQTRPYIGRTVSAASHACLRVWSEEFLQAHTDLFAARVHAGRIVDGHGDLHLRNMCQLDGRVLIFDCIEFNPALRAGDVMNDIAFLIMDLHHRALTALANRFLNEYLEKTRDTVGLKLLDFYRAYRACVRAKVMSFASDSAPTAERRNVEQEAASYFDLAEQTIAARAPGLLLTCGVSGSGKTTLARQACEILDGVMVRSDAVRKHLAGIPLSVRGAQSGGDIYTPAMTTRTYAALLQHAREIIASGRWAILDAVFGKHSERAAAATLARELRVPFGILYCVAPHAELVRRLDQRTAEGHDISDATVAVLEQQQTHFESPSQEEGPQFLWTGKENPAAWLISLRARR
jgi:aminoglycoside phosphotransferase family enzyme/predicted kinase